MRAMIAVLIFGLICSASDVMAAGPNATYSPEDFARAMREAPCADDHARDYDGTCRVGGPDTRGFNLGARGHGRGTSTPGGGQIVRARSALDNLRITFRSGSAQMTARGRAEARNFAAALMMPGLSKRRFEIAGHTDAAGSASHNRALSQARADAVVDFLVAQGVDRDRLEAKGYGSEHLARPDAPRDAANRRVEARSLN